MKACPYCAEQIQDAARLCRYCGRNVLTTAPDPLNDAGSYDVPWRHERKEFSHNVGHAGSTASSSGFAIKGSVCPNCMSSNYVQKFSLWHGVLAIVLFPLGLICLAFPIKRCAQCKTDYGAGVQITKALGIFALGFLVLAVLIVALASNST